MASSTNCSALRESVLALFASELEVSLLDRGCLVTLPMKTADDRHVAVWVESIPDSGLVYVHDGGKNTSELFAQGIHRTPTQDRLFTGIARRHRAYYQHGRFQIPCSGTDLDAIRQAVFAISQCVTLAMLEVVTHEPVVEEEPLVRRVGRILDDWHPPYVEIARRVPVVGRTGGHHVFDFVSRGAETIAPRPVTRTVAIKLLPPSVGPSWQTSRYAYMALDLEQQEAAAWPRLAIVTRSEEWSAKNLQTIRSMSADVILLTGDHERRLDEVLPDKMTRLTSAA